MYFVMFPCTIYVENSPFFPTFQLPNNFRMGTALRTLSTIAQDTVSGNIRTSGIRTCGIAHTFTSPPSINLDPKFPSNTSHVRSQFVGDGDNVRILMIQGTTSTICGASVDKDSHGFHTCCEITFSFPTITRFDLIKTTATFFPSQHFIIFTDGDTSNWMKSNVIESYHRSDVASGRFVRLLKSYKL